MILQKAITYPDSRSLTSVLASPLLIQRVGFFIAYDRTMKDVTTKPKIVLTDEEKKRLVAYFNVLIEMDLELKKLGNGEKRDEDKRS